MNASGGPASGAVSASSIVRLRRRMSGETSMGLGWHHGTGTGGITHVFCRQTIISARWPATKPAVRRERRPEGLLPRASRHGGNVQMDVNCRPANLSRRRFLSLGAIGALTGLIAACGSQQPGTAGPSPTATLTSRVATPTPAPAATSVTSSSSGSAGTTPTAKAGGVDQFVTAEPTAAAEAARNYVSRGPSAGQKVVTYWHEWSGQWEFVVDRIVAWFNALHPSYFVKPLVISGDYRAKFLSAVAGGSPPDVLSDISDQLAVPAWADQDALKPLDDFLGTGEMAAFKSWFWPICWSIGTYKGKLWATASTM